MVAAAQEAGVPLLVAEPGEEEGALLTRATSGADAVLIDRKLPYSRSLVTSLNAARPVVLVDVVCDGMFAAAATVFPNAHLDPAIATDPRWRSTGRLFHGADWTVIHPRVRATAAQAGGADSRPRLAVVTGGSDPADVASRACDWGDAVPRDFDVEVLVGAANANRHVLGRRAECARHPTTVLEDPKEFPGRLASATAAVATFGVTAYELAYLGVPAVLVSHNLENAAGAARFVRHGSALDLGLAESVDRTAAAGAIASLLGDGAARERMRAAGRRLVDGRGAERIVALVEELVRERAK